MRLRDPGQALGVQQLFERGWAGEHVLAEAASMRVYVSLMALRKLGLRGVLLRRGGGYLLDPAVDVRVVRTRIGAVS